MRRLAVLSMHTSPLAQPGTGDGGGMNVYVRELSSALARRGVICDVYTRRWSPELPDVVAVEPGFAVHHVAAGPPVPVAKETLQEHVEEFTESVIDRMTSPPAASARRAIELPADAIHANYWLSGLAGHAIKHRLGLPLVSTFHTLDRVKAEASPEEVESAEPGRRARAESEIIGCSDALLASCPVEVDQLVELYGADRDRVEVVPLGVDHAFFSPGDRAMRGGRSASTAKARCCCSSGRIQPLKGADVALERLRAFSSGPSRTPSSSSSAARAARGASAEVAHLARDGRGARISAAGCASWRRSPTSCSRRTTGRPTAASCRRDRSRSGSSRWRRPRAAPRSWRPRSGG